MKFKDYLNQYMEMLGCSAKELADACELSSAVISRYRTGEREPAKGSDQLEKLIRGTAMLFESKGMADMSAEKIRAELESSLNLKNTTFENFVKNFDSLISALNINMKALAAASSFDVSYLYRVRAGQRHPSDLNAFCSNLCRYIVSRHSTPRDKEIVASLTGYALEQLQTDTDYMNQLQHWLYHGAVTHTAGDMEQFLNNLDSFNLDEYIRAIHFDELKVPAIPFQIYSPRSYYGIEEMRKGELDFFKHTVLAKSMEPIFMCSDMPMADMAKDMDFNRKWMFAIAMSLKKGLHLNIIHNIDRPFHEMMLGLESWIPIYMTGQVSPYHLPNMPTPVYHHFTYVSGTVALAGECISGHHDHGKYYLTNNREEVAYYKQKAADLLEKAQPLMEIFRAESETRFETYQQTEVQEPGNRHNLLSAPPIYTITPELLTRILKRAGLSSKDQERLLYHAENQRRLAKKTMEHALIFDEFATIPEDEFQRHPLQLSLDDAFYEADIPYTYEEYLAHIRFTKDFAAAHPHYKVSAEAKQTFRNIQIHIVEGKLVRISKSRTPVIHFVIRHPKMVHALEHFVSPITE
ncbi:MAG: helix-turn-helix transcriptional regulator [bacterium]|nr:helix-turn-helix transcriptional regulator [bacterium]MDY4099852.1 helix-turn-helix transcriptional regulator [Lachnospiraceae bacterium]